MWECDAGTKELVVEAMCVKTWVIRGCGVSDVELFLMWFSSVLKDCGFYFHCRQSVASTNSYGDIAIHIKETRPMPQRNFV